MSRPEHLQQPAGRGVGQKLRVESLVALPPENAGTPAGGDDLAFARELRIGRTTFLISYSDRDSFEQTVIGIAQTLARARKRNRAVVFVHKNELSHPELYDLCADGVEIVGGRIRKWLVLQLARLSGPPRILTSLRAAVATDLKRRVSASRNAEPTARLATQVRGYVKHAIKRLDSVNGDSAAGALDPPRLRRRLVREPVPVTLPSPMERRAASTLDELGVSSDASLVCLYARESCFKQQQEDTKDRMTRPKAVRNASVANYDQTIDLLLSHGFTVVRLGEAWMTPLGREDVIDLVASPVRTPLLELYCMLRASLVVSSDTGPCAISLLTGTPLLCVNATDPISAYPIRADSFLVTKTVVDRKTMLPLGMNDLLSERYQSHLRDPTRFAFLENTPIEIRSAVSEALRWLAGDTAETDRQRQYREATAAASERLRGQVEHVRRWGADHGFIGDGRVADFWLEQNW